MTRPPSLVRRHLLGAAALAWMAGPAVRAQGGTFPTRPLRLIAAGPAGATADLIARLVADPLARALGQSAIVEPKPGAAGALAVGDLVQAPHDGHTLLVGVSSLVSEIPHIVKLRLDMAKELRPLAELARGGLVLVGHPGLPARNLAELIAHVKARPGQVNVASYSPGTLSHVLGLLLNQAAGIDLQHVGYKGSTPALADVMGGHVPLMFDGIGTSLPLIRAGKLRAFAVSLPRRSPVLPDVPTFTELGYPSLEALSWMGLWCPPDVPAAAQARLRDAALAALQQPALRSRLQELGFEVGSPRSPDELAAGLKAEYERVGAVLRGIGFKAE
ncbi:Bug family tripartite tricarboxylate transporter substrate binding protein [Sphaerotilus microaerophilus]|uniref:MFS transporter n=1 Tax=Sphaerotilus microaerophilus TaxID=2914710 RepID=A0ABM7YN19_9BURK|nr:tripartite tricarboxylate transporter substrate binding protein [Sphaerotilus sp. FB-5]BDI05870.1 MFS transporter [Sphaerotilus sp. FB-5]